MEFLIFSYKYIFVQFYCGDNRNSGPDYFWVCLWNDMDECGIVHETMNTGVHICVNISALCFVYVNM